MRSRARGRGTVRRGAEVLAMLEGSRAFDIAWGTVTGSLCFMLGAIVVAHWVRGWHARGTSLFGAAVDPKRRLELAYGAFALAMGGTNMGCRYIAHNYLAAVHEGYAALTLVAVAVLVPALGIAARRPRTPRRFSLDA